MEKVVSKYNDADTFSRIGFQYESIMKRFDKADILEENKELALEFIEVCRLGLFQKKIGMQRTVRTLNSLKRLCEMLPPSLNWHNVTKKDIRGLLLDIEGLEAQGWEKYSLLMVLKKFVTWIRTEYGYPKDYIDREKYLSLLPILEVAPEVRIHIERPNKLKSLDEIPTAQEIQNMLDACDFPYLIPLPGPNPRIRNKAILSILGEVGARIGAIGPLKIKDVLFDEIGAKLMMTDKTLRGEGIRIITSAPLLKAWIELHPNKSNPDAPLWVVLRGKSKGKMLDYGGMRKAIRDTILLHNKYAESKGLPKITRRVHPHAFRYFAQSRDALNGMPTAVMCKQRGWSATSKQPQRYARISGEQVDNWLLSHQDQGQL